jgi:Meiotically up-regulated gene 113
MTELAEFVSFDPDRHGNPRHYFRPFGRRIRLREAPGTQAFLDEIESAEIAIEQLPKRQRLSTARMAMVYFILHGNKRVKIGFSVQVDRRLSEIQVSLPSKAKILYLTPGDTELEKRLHQLFAADRVSGEWFYYSPAIRAWIAADKARREERVGNDFCRTSENPGSGIVSLSNFAR